MKKKASGNVNIEWDPGEVNPKQKEFLDSHTLFTCDGGAKGGIAGGAMKLISFALAAAIAADVAAIVASWSTG